MSKVLSRKFQLKLDEFEFNRNRQLIDIDMNKLFEISAELSQINYPRELWELYNDTNFSVTQTCMFIRVLRKLALELNTPTPNWKKVVWILYDHWRNIILEDDTKAFWAIGDPSREEGFKLVRCEMYASDLVNTNQTGVSLERIMSSFFITLKLYKIKTCTDYTRVRSVFTNRVVSTFINQLYFDNYMHRNHLRVDKIEDDHSDIDEQLDSAVDSYLFDFDPEDCANSSDNSEDEYDDRDYDTYDEEFDSESEETVWSDTDK
jgi:hypothetical protein